METLIESEQSKAVYLRLLRQEAMLSRILDELEGIRFKLSNEPHSETPMIRNRRLRLLRIILENRETANITEITKRIGRDQKTVRSDLSLLATEGLTLYMKGDKHSNPGRRGNRPRLTRRGRKIAEAAFELDRQENSPV